jgi:hypothetical protein
MLSEVKTGCQSHFRFRSYGGKTFPVFLKIDFFVTEGAKIADGCQKQNCKAPYVTFRSENRMSIQFPLWRENTSGLSKSDFFVTEGAQIADDISK